MHLHFFFGGGGEEQSYENEGTFVVHDKNVSTGAPCVDVLVMDNKIGIIRQYITQITIAGYLLCNCRNGSLKALFEMIVASEYVSEYCIWLVLRNGLQQLTDAGQLPFSVTNLSTTGVVVSCTYIRFLNITVNICNLSVQPI